MIRTGKDVRRITKFVEDVENELTGDLGDVLMPRITARQFSDFERKVKKETVELVLSKVEEVLESNVTPGLSIDIINEIKESVYD